uniref:Ig-like domain-containing protein n=1 Tax=Cyprinus carpio carpio TaxID=630221 RepID=A0A9J8ABM5_CYPCA
MDLFMCIFVAVITVISEAFTVHGPSAPLVAPLGSSVVLLCYVDELLVMEGLEVEWRRTDSGTLVHLYQDGESRPEVQQQDYHDRAHFFTDQIQHGNFSLRLDNLRAEDEGRYTCRVHSQQDSGETVVRIKHECLLVSGSDRSVSAYDGEDVTLSCSVDSHIKPEHIEEVSWRKTDGYILVLLFQNNKTLPDSSDERYRGRAELFTAEIPKGNFSLRLKSIRTEDKGVYMCHVFAGGLSANATVVLVQLGFSWLHITVLILCIVASGSALLSWLVYSRTGNRNKRLCLQVCLFLCPDVTMLLASIIWFVIEGSLYETVSCCMLYVLGPLRLFWVKPLATDLPDKILKYIMISHTDHAAFMAVMYSVLLAEHFPNVSTVFSSSSFGLLVLMCLLFITQLAKEKVLACSGESSRKMYSKVSKFVATCGFSWLPSLQLALLLYTHFASGAVFIITALPALHWVSYIFCNGKKCADQYCQYFLCKLIWLMMIAITGVVMYFYIMLLRNKEADAGPVCVAGFVQALWVLAFSEVPVNYQKLRMRKILFLYGSAGLVLVNSAALMTELIMKAVHGVRLVGDLRIVLFPSEWLFTVALLVLSVFVPWKVGSTGSQKASQMLTDNGTPGTNHTSLDMTQKTGESHEMETLRNAGNSEEHQEEEIN